MSVAYSEPCRRPTDGRFGDNPNRAQHYFQYQVIIKPSPEGIQEIYLTSLESLGINPKHHDIRFVEDNWESPTLGAWELVGKFGWMEWKSHNSHISNSVVELTVTLSLSK